MIHVGKKQTMTVESEDNSGFYLLCADRNEVFMPGTLAPAGLKTADQVEVFVFVNSENDVIATGKMPIAQVGEFACLQVKAITPQGAYLDMGLPKDLLVPKSVQKYEMHVGEIHLVRVMIEDDNNRLYGSEKIDGFIDSALNKLASKQPISIIPFHKTPLGFKVLIDNLYLGIVYHNEVFQEVVLGETYQGTVKAVREDGHVDALLREIGMKAVSSNADLVLDALKKSSGHLNLGDKSSPDDIRDVFPMSKKSFKAAIGNLYKQKIIKISATSIELI
jgi:predicted RNA-binding protein (virulence factor B family)